MFLLISNFGFGQIILHEVSDLWTPELMVANEISQIIFLPSRGDTILSNYGTDGQVEIEYLIDKEGKDTSTVFYTYDDLSLIHI